MLQYYSLHFSELSLDQLYSIMRLRQEVFVVEQACAYLDLDNLDQKGIHIIGENNEGQIESYARIFSKGISYPQYQSIGRIITSAKIRGTGEGKRLVQFAIESCRSYFGKDSIKISAQSHLRPFYQAFGFTQIGEGYLEDDIPHHAMILE